MAVNVRVEARRMPPGSSKSDGIRNVTNLLKALKRALEDAGVPRDMKKHECFIRKCDIARRKRDMKKRAPLLAEMRAKEEANDKKKDKKEKKPYGRS